MSSSDSDDSDVEREDILSAFSGFDDTDEYAPLWDFLLWRFDRIVRCDGYVLGGMTPFEVAWEYLMHREKIAYEKEKKWFDVPGIEVFDPSVPPLSLMPPLVRAVFLSGAFDPFSTCAMREWHDSWPARFPEVWQPRSFTSTVLDEFEAWMTADQEPVDQEPADQETRRARMLHETCACVRNYRSKIG